MNKKRWGNRKGGIELSFGMIFSIILIIAFLASGFYAITKFLELQKTMQIEKFFSDLQNDIDDMWKSSQGSLPREYMLPNDIISVCFRNDEFENLQFNANKIIAGKMIQHIDIEKTIGDANSLCIANVRGKVSMTLVKNFEDVLVTITK